MLFCTVCDDSSERYRAKPVYNTVSAGLRLTFCIFSSIRPTIAVLVTATVVAVVVVPVALVAAECGVTVDAASVGHGASAATGK